MSRGKEEAERRGCRTEGSRGRLKVTTHANMEMLSCQILSDVVLASNGFGSTFE